MRRDRKLFPDSLHGRLLALLIPALGSLLAFNLWTDFRAAREFTVEPFDRSLVDTAIALGAHVQSHDQKFSLDLSPEAALTLRINRYDDTYYSIRGPDGMVVTGIRNLPAAPHPFAESPSFFDAEYLGKPVRVVLYRSATPLGKVTVQVAQATGRRDQRAQQFVREDLLQDMLQDIFLLVAMVILVLLGVRMGLKPLSRVRADLEQRAPGDLRPLQEAEVPSEVRPLVQALNRQIKLLKAASEAQQNFLANAAHQLRMPLASLQTQIEVTARENDPSRVRQGLAGLQTAARRTAHLANQLLALARAQNSANLSQGKQSVDLREVMVDCASLYFDRAVAKDIDLKFETTSVIVAGWKWMIRELAANLIDNALSYTPRGGNVTVRCGLNRRQPFLEVEDSGPGIPKTERAQVFERFYRLSGSDNNGSGLGLAIVNEIVATHRATIALSEPAAGGTRFTVTFPANAEV